MRKGVRRGALLCAAGAMSAIAIGLGAGSALASTVSFSNRCCFEMRIGGDDAANQLHLRADGGRLVVHDAAMGASIAFHGPASRCTGEGTATLSCARDFLVNPVTVLLVVGPGDSFDI